MNNTRKFIIGGAITLFVLIIAVTIFLYTLLTKSIPDTEGTIKLEGLAGEVSIYRNEFGIPQIMAVNEHDLMFAFGYAVAQDRLWQMDIQRRLGEGRLSEVFGEETIEIDALFRTVGIGRIATDMETHLSKESKDALQAYSDGINAFIDKNRKKLQVEFDLLGYEPEKWEIKHSLIILRLFAWQMNLSWWTDLSNREIIRKLGEARAADIINCSSSTILAADKNNFADNMIRVWKYAESKFGLSPMAGSNAWVISGAKSETGYPLLANDPHLLLSAPSTWYQASLHTDKLDITGLSIPGIPGIVIGSNGKTSWGITNGMVDDCDFFQETIDSAGLNKYYYEGAWNNLLVLNEKIKIKNSDPLDFRVYYTNKGPIISYFTEFNEFYNNRRLNLRNSELSPIKGQQVSMKWCGFEHSDDLLGLILINKSKSIIEIEEALKHIKSPALNFVFCDKSNIGAKLSGLVPIRNHSSAHSVLPGTTGEYLWKGFINYEELPSSTNPENNFYVSANNKLSSPYYISNLWENPARFDRITQLLNSKNKFSVDDMQKIQNDNISANAKILLPIIISVLEKKNNTEYYYSQAVTYLKNWDCSMDKSSISASIYNVLFSKILKNTIADDLGDNLFSKFSFVAIQPINALTKIITENKASWFDNINTPGVLETRDEIIHKSFLESLDYLKSRLGYETKNWRWAGLHTLTLKHPFSKQKPLDKIFNIGPYETDGNNATINCGYYDFNNPFEQVFGPSSRFICDMSNPDYSYSINSSGSSGQPFSKHYGDQLSMMIDGKYITLCNISEKIKSSGFKLLRLLPAN